MDAREVPFDLLQGQASTSTQTRDGHRSHGPAVYLTHRGLLVRIGLQPATGGVREELTRVLEALSTGPTPREQDVGIGSAIPAGLRIAVARVTGGRAEIDLRGDVAQPDVGQNALATGQIVLTATSVDGVEIVSLTRDGRPFRPVLPGGHLAAAAVSQSDYTVLVAPTAAPSTAP